MNIPACLCRVVLPVSIVVASSGAVAQTMATQTAEVDLNGPVTVTQQHALPVPPNGDTYVIGPNDHLSVQVFDLPELKLDDVQVDGSGKISVPLAGPMVVAGLTSEAVAEMIASELRNKYVKNPLVTVNVRESKSQSFVVDGEVREPGNYPVVGKVTLIKAIASAKGLSDFAKLDNVIVFREVDDRKYAAVYNLKSIRSGIYGDPRIYANDTVVVGTSRFRKFQRDFIQILPAITNPLVLLIR